MIKGEKKLNSFVKILIIIGSILASLLVFMGNTALAAFVSKNRVNDDPIYVKPTGTGLVFAKNRSLYDKDGNILRLRGVNVGGLLNTEGWMVPYSCGPLTDDHGNPISWGGYVAYPSLSEDEARQGLLENPYLSDAQKKHVVETYRANWFSDNDFYLLKNTFNFNCIRLPVYWGEMMEYKDDEFVLKDEDEAFAYLDYFLSKCLENEIYCVFDLHATPITQSGYEHSGHMTWVKDELLWYSEKGIQATCDLWAFIANHYKDSELGKIIATYDLINEPSSDKGEYLESDPRYTTKDCYPVFDRIYKTIRACGDQHVITMNFIWTYWQLPNPSTFGWKNIQYQIHLYNDMREKISWDTMFYGLEFTRMFHDWRVPIYVGEFTGYSKADDWIYLLDAFERMGYSWTFWTFKKTVVGDWSDSWGLYNNCLRFPYNSNRQKVNLRSASYSELMQTFEETNTTNCRLSDIGQTLIDYMSNLK